MDQAVGQRLQAARKACGLTLAVTSQRAGMSKSFLHDVEQGADIAASRLCRLTEVLGVSMDAVMRGTSSGERIVAKDACRRCGMHRGDHHYVNFSDGPIVGEGFLVCPTAVFATPVLKDEGTES